MSAKKHLHIYRRVDIGKKEFNKQTRRWERLNSHIVYKCVLDGCSHYQIPELLVGRTAQCSRCGGEFVVTQRMVGSDKRVNLYCDDCKKDKKTKATEEFLSELGLVE